MWEIALIIAGLGIAFMLLLVTMYYSMTEDSPLKTVFKYGGGIITLIVLLLPIATSVQIINYELTGSTVNLSNVSTYMTVGLTVFVALIILVFGLAIVDLAMKAVTSIGKRKEDKQMGRLPR